MRTALARIWKALPAAFAFAILAVQMWVPFSARNFQTQDGASYVYNAVVARDLILDPHSPYAAVYQFRHAFVPNWGGTIMLNIILCFVPVEYSEKTLMSVTILIGFFCLAYSIRSFAPHVSPWTPLINFPLQTGLLWEGFYDFYLGTMAAMVLIGYYVRRTGRMTARTGITLAAGLVGIFLIHLMGAAIAMLGLGVLAIWRWRVEPERADPRAAWRQIGLAAATMVPTLVLAIAFALPASSRLPPGYLMSPIEALVEFPLKVFDISGELLGEDTFLWPVMLAAIALVIARLTRSEWKSVHGGLAVAAIVSFIAYLTVPDGGFGGGQAKVRFAWSLFIFGTVLVISTPKFTALRTGLMLYVTLLLAGNLVSSVRMLSAYSVAIDDYLAALGDFPRGSRMIRANYTTRDIPLRYGFPLVHRNPLLRVDSFFAARCHCVDLTDYQPLNDIFPIILRPRVDPDRQLRLWHDFQVGGRGTAGSLRFLSEGALGPIDYVIVVADRLSLANSGYFPALLANLYEMDMHLTPQSRQSSFVRVYARDTR